MGAAGPTQTIGRSPSQESLLVNFVKRLAGNPGGWTAVHMHFSGLRPYHRRDHYIRAATATVDTVVKEYGGQLFALSNQDMVFLLKAAPPQDIKGVVEKLRILFADDPLAQGETPEDLELFATSYDLGQSHEGFLRVAQHLNRDREHRVRSQAMAGLSPNKLVKSNKKPIEPDQLGQLEYFLKSADMSNLMRRQAICAIGDDLRRPKKLFFELFISIAELRDTVLPDHNIASNMWLFQHLTQTLDSRMLHLLMRNDDSSISRSFSINLNVETVLSETFLKFDATLDFQARGTIVIELQSIDIFCDLGAYLFAKDFLHERGYRVCLAGLRHNTLHFIEREKLDLDVLKVIWSPDMTDDITGQKQEDLREQIIRSRQTRIILCRCDDEDAILFGRSIGIHLFQGRHIDKLLQESHLV